MVRHPHNMSRLAPADAQSEADDTIANVRRDRDNPSPDPKKKQQNDTLFLASYCLVCSKSEITNATETRTRCLPTLMIILCLNQDERWLYYHRSLDLMIFITSIYH